jgi:hypothetical protein
MAETKHFRGWNKARLGIIHLWGKRMLYTSLYIAVGIGNARYQEVVQ